MKLVSFVYIYLVSMISCRIVIEHVATFLLDYAIINFIGYFRCIDGTSTIDHTLRTSFSPALRSGIVFSDRAPCIYGSSQSRDVKSIHGSVLVVRPSGRVKKRSPKTQSPFHLPARR